MYPKISSSACFVGLLLAVALAAMPGGESKGLTVYIASRKPHLPCEDGHLVKAYLMRNGRVRLNNEEFDRNEFLTRLDSIFKTRGVWLLFIGADPHVAFQVLADTIAAAQAHVDYVSLMTPTAERSAGCLAVSLPLQSKDHSR